MFTYTPKRLCIIKLHKINHLFSLWINQFFLQYAGSGVGSVLPNAGAAEIKVTLGAMDAVLTKVLNLCAKPETIAAGGLGFIVRESFCIYNIFT